MPTHFIYDVFLVDLHILFCEDIACQGVSQCPGIMSIHFYIFIFQELVICSMGIGLWCLLNKYSSFKNCIILAPKIILA